MKILLSTFNQYSLFMKKLTTTIGTIIIYFTAILFGKIIYFFIPSNSSQKWQNYQSGQASDKMF